MILLGGRGEIDNAPYSNRVTGGASPTRPLHELFVMLLDMTGGEPVLVD